MAENTPASVRESPFFRKVEDISSDLYRIWNIEFITSDFVERMFRDIGTHHKLTGCDHGYWFTDRQVEGVLSLGYLLEEMVAALNEKVNELIENTA